MNQEVFMARVKEAREKKKLTIQELADACGVSLSSMNRYVALTAQPSLDMACKIADALGVSLDWLCGQEEKQQPPSLGTVIGALSMLLTTKVIDSKTPTWAADFNTTEFSDGSTDTYIATHQENLSHHVAFESWQTLLNLYRSGEIDEEMYSAWVEKKIKECSHFRFPMIINTGFSPVETEELPF